MNATGETVPSHMQEGRVHLPLVTSTEIGKVLRDKYSLTRPLVPRAGCDNRSIFKLSTAGFNLSFFLPDRLTKPRVKDPVNPNIFP